MAKLLSILLQRSDPAYPWGFTVRGGLQDGAPLVIDQVTPGALAAQYLAAGDTILQIEKVDTRLLWNSQVEALISQPGKSLDLLLLKGDSPPTFPRTSASPGPRPVYSSDSGSASGGSTGCGRDLRQRKQHFWERVSNEDKDFSKEGFTRLESGANSPFKQRSRIDQWRRCQSEEKSGPRYEDNYSAFTDGSQRSRKISDASSYSNRVQSVWSPNPDRSRTPTSNFLPRDEKLGSNEERQGDITFWEYNASERQSSEPKSVRSGSLNRSYRRHHSDFSHQGYSSGYSDYTTTPELELDSERDPTFESNQVFMKKPSDFWGDHYRDEQRRIRLGSVTSPTSSLDSVWKNTVSKTEFKKSTSVKQTSYSSTEGAKSFETFEHVNKTKETEKTCKTVDGGKEEVIEKTKKNKEHIIANKDDANGQPKETTKVINDFKSIEKVMDGENEFCNKVKEHKEEVINSNTPVNFYDNVQQHGVVENPTVQKAEWCDHTVNRHKEVGQVGSDETFIVKDDTETRSSNFSPFIGRDADQKRWASSTPMSEEEHFNEGFVYQQEEPLMENYFEVDIRSPIEMEVVFSSPEEQIRRQSSQISGGGSPIPVSHQGDSQVPPPPPPPPTSCPPAPPPPPPPGLTGNIPAVRLSTEVPEKRRSAYEPPAAIQNAMMTKDKKPFTYTPGGLDLSEIRSPRMARRINRNANAPDSAPTQPQPRPTSVSGPLPPSALAAMQPQIAIPVLPQGGGVPHLHHVIPGGHSAPPPPPPPPQLPTQTVSSPPPQPPPPQKIPIQPMSPQKVINRQPSPPPMAVPKLQPQHRHTKSEPQTSTPGSIYVPPIETQQPRSQLGSLYIPPLAPQETVKPQSPVSQLNKAPTPWMSRQNQQAPKEVPPWVNREAIQSPPSQSQNQQQPQTRVIPIQIEGKEPASKPNERIIPIQLEGTPSPQPQSQAPQYYNQPPNYQQQQQQYQQQQYQQQQFQQANSGRQTPQNPRWMNQQPVYVHNKFNSGSQSPVPAEQNHGGSQPSWRHSQTNGAPQSPGPVQSQSFKVLQKITGTDGVDQSDSPYNSQGVPLSQLRKLQLSDDDRALMDKVKSQVDDETYLHNESDPRYRGSAIPSRAFRILQNMTDGAGEGLDVPQAYSPVQGGQNRLAANRTPQPDAPQQYVPPSEQQAQEPRKYTGGAIPSRSFRMLQAMTAGTDSSAAMSDGRQTPQIYNGGEVMWAPNNFQYPPPPPPPNPNYYYYPSPPPQTTEQQQQFWDHYNAMCSYVAEMNNSYGYPPYGYPPQLYTPPPSQSLQYASDSDECGYSSTDEMNYYAAYFKKYPPPIQPYRTYCPDNRAQTPQIIITPSRSYGNSGYSSDLVSDSEKEINQNKSSVSSSPTVYGDSGETTTDDGSDTEVEDDDVDRPQGLQTIRSVPDISVYKDSSSSDIHSQNSETDEPDEEINEEEEEYEDDLPHQLSVIFEESEHSEIESLNKIKCRNVDGDTTSEGESSTATLDNEDDTDDEIVDAESSTVLVRLPLKLKFSKTENNEDLTTVTVGDSEIESSPEAEVRPGDLIIQEVKRVDDEPDVSVTFTIPKKRTKPPEVICEISEAENNKEEFKLSKQSVSEDNYELTNNSNSSDSKTVICDKEVSVVVNCDGTSNNIKNENRCKSESPIDFWKELSCDDTSTKSLVPADVSINVTLPPKSLTKSGSRSPFNNFTSESDDSRPEESDGHWEDDSSSTSVQTVRIGKHSGSDNFSGSEIENCGTADEVEDILKVSSPCEIERRDMTDANVSREEGSKSIDDDHERIPIEDLLYDDTSSSDDDDESSTSSSSSESSEEISAVSEQSKEAKQTSVASNDSSRGEEKCDDDVFLSESSKSEASNHLTVEQKPKKVRGTSCKSQDESEEDDSGVTSDMSRHISETDTEPECGSELRKLTPYQRASTHSRLFKLLQDECSAENEDQNPPEDNICDTESISSRKERLSLPLQTYTPSDPDSMSSSSGINSPVSPTVNDRLVRELVQSLLHKKKGRHFRKLPMDKLYAAAVRILQEDMDPYDTLSSMSDDSFQHSPISESTANQTNNTATNPATHTQEVYETNYYDYCDYYNTWGNPYYYSDVEDSLGYDIIPSRAFKLLQERAQTPHGFSSGVIEGLVAKCPRVLSSKDVPKDLGEVPVPDSCPQASSSSET